MTILDSTSIEIAMNRILIFLIIFILTGCGGADSANKGDDSDTLIGGILATSITEKQASAFLWKVNFGPTSESIVDLRRMGYRNFVESELLKPPNQFQKYMLTPVSHYHSQMPNYCAQFPDSLYVCMNWIADERRAPSIGFLKSAVHDQDQLRLRVTWALSQILVVSSNISGRMNYGLNNYMQLLRDNAFGNYRDLLLKITINPYMGRWLDLAGSKKENPNQNYARELLQLFSVGVFSRKSDGTYILNAEGGRIENYTQEDVLNYSKALTGWSYSRQNIYEHELSMFEDDLDRSSKKLLTGYTIPQGASGIKSLNLVIDSLFHHPSTAPNISRQLIQLLVTSNPSSAYVNRVVRVWNNNGSNVKGDLRAVVRAILLDSEALNPPDNGGKLLEPVIALTGLVRAVGGQTDGVALDVAAAQLLQRPFGAPSVFNFYPPEYYLPLKGLRRHAPQFAILNISTEASRLNSIRQLIFSDSITPDTSVPSAVRRGTALAWPSNWKIMAADSIPALIDLLNVRLAGGGLELAQRNHISSVVGAMPSGSNYYNLERLRMATWLVLSSPQFMTHR